MRREEDCGFRDQREVDIYYGRCPDCGDVKVAGECHCTIPPAPEQPPTPNEVKTDENPDDIIPF
jgi:hypothetical protein